MPTALALLLLASLGVLVACGGGSASGPATGHPLDDLATATIGVGGEAVEVWLARTDAEQTQGLKGITPAQIAPLPDGTERGMLFVWPEDTVPSFWMKDTIVPLDLAYLAADGLILEIHAMAPLDETPVTATTPVRYALELRGGFFASRGVGVGDRVLLTGP